MRLPCTLHCYASTSPLMCMHCYASTSPLMCMPCTLYPAALHPIAGYLPGYPTGFPPGPDAGYGMPGPDTYGMSVGGPWGGGAHVAGPSSHALPHGHSHGHVPTPAGGALLHAPHAPGTYYQASVG